MQAVEIREVHAPMYEELVTEPVLSIKSLVPHSLSGLKGNGCVKHYQLCEELAVC